MANKRKLNSKHPKYISGEQAAGPEVAKIVHICEAPPRSSSKGNPSKNTVTVTAVFYA